MSRLVIVGNSGAARECYWIIRDMAESAAPGEAPWEFAGFYAFGGHPGNLRELAPLFRGNIEDHEVSPDERYVIGIGQPELRKTIFEALTGRGARFTNLIHPWTSLCPSAVIGTGNIFQRGCTVYANASIGNGNYINGAVNIAHDAVIGDFNFLAPYSIVLGGARVGSLNWLAPHAVIMDRARVGDSNLVGPNSSVFKGCGDHTRLLGAPALRVGRYGENDGP